MDADKENKWNASVEAPPSDSSFNRLNGELDDPPQVYNERFSQPDPVPYEMPPMTPADVRLQETFPELAAFMNRMKLIAPIAGLSQDFLEPMALSLENDMESVKGLREHAGDVTGMMSAQIEYFDGIFFNLEKELLPILQFFGCGLPTEPWHVDAISTVVTAKLKAAKTPSAI